MLFCNLWSVFDQQIPVLFFSMSSPMTVRETPLICTFPSGSREEMLLFVLHRWICANTLILLRWDGKYVSMPFHILSASQITSTERKIIYIYTWFHVPYSCPTKWYRLPCSTRYHYVLQAICSISNVQHRICKLFATFLMFIFDLPSSTFHPTLPTQPLTMPFHILSAS